MAYIGNIPAEKFTSVDIQNFTVSATANYTLDRPVANENEIELFINNVRQHPGSGKAYTASGTALTLSEATAGTDTMYCVYQGKARQTVTPATSSVTNAMLAGSIDLTSKVTGALPQANIADEAINEAKMQISNAPTNGYMLTAQSGNTGGLTWAEAGGGAFEKLVSGSASSAVNHDFENFMDTSKYNSYMVQFSEVIGLNSNALHFQFKANTTVLTNSNYWFAFHGHRSTDNEIKNYGEQEAQAALGSALVGSSGNAGNYLFYIYNNPNSTTMGNNVYGHNWGYRSDLGDYLFTDFAFGFNNTHNVTGFRVHAQGNDATTFDYAIYGIAK